MKYWQLAGATSRYEKCCWHVAMAIVTIAVHHPAIFARYSRPNWWSNA